MKSFKAKVVALMLVLALALTGCAQIDVGVTINQDGSGKEVGTVTIDKQEMVKQMKLVGIASGTPIKDSDIKDMEKELISGGYKLVTIDGKEYYTMQETQNIKKGELQKEFGSDGGASYVTTDTFYVTLDMSDADDRGAMLSSSELKAYGITDVSDIMKFNISVEMPQNIVNTNGKIDPSNPKKVTFDVSLTGKNVLFATTKSGVTKESVKATINKLNAVKAPKKLKLKANAVKANAKKATITVKYKKVSGAKKYQIQYSAKKNFKGAKSKYTSKLTYTINKLKKGKKYYVRVRAGKVNYAGQMVYGKWTKKSVKTKK